MIDGQINIIIISLTDSLDRVAHACMLNVNVMPTWKESSWNLSQDEWLCLDMSVFILSLNFLKINVSYLFELKISKPKF